MGLKLCQRYVLLCCLLTVLFWGLLTLVSQIYDDNERSSQYLEDGVTGNDKLDSTSDDMSQDISTLGIVRNQDDLKIREDGYATHAFNLLISNRLSLHRKIKDTRHELCHKQRHPTNLPSASIVICFYNEAWTVLLRTIHSILDRTPNTFLHEIILVDDFSDITDLKEKLENYVKAFAKVQIIRTKKREGLIRGRIIGAQAAHGQVLVFLDSHCEVNIDWLQPLLQQIQEDPHSVVCPIIDIVSSDTFEYKSSPIVRGGFNWGLHFSWEPIPPALLKNPEDYIRPIRSPTMAGGLFAIDREYFYKLGKYDEGMHIWGAENLEISFRIWMCGGKLKIIPCSRVGHLFRRWRPYGSDSMGDTLSWNSMRLAEVWLDNYKKYFYDTRKELKGKPYGDISSRVSLRKKLKCKSFEWYMKTVYPELKLPDQQDIGVWHSFSRRPPVITWKGKLQSSVGDGVNCLDSPGHPSEKRAIVILHACEETNSKYWSINDDNEFKIQSLLCLEASHSQYKHSLKIMKCHSQGGNQQWKYIKKKSLMYHPATGLCLSVHDSGEHVTVHMEICDNSVRQNWKFIY